MTMMPASAVGAHNYELLGNQRVGETHESRMARVNSVGTAGPALVGQASKPTQVRGTRPMGWSATSNGFAYGLAGGLASAALTSLLLPRLDLDMSEKQIRKWTVVNGLVGGTAAGAGIQSKVAPGWAKWGTSWTGAALIGGGLALSATALLVSSKMFKTVSTGVKFGDALRDPVTLGVGIGIPALIGFSVAEGMRKDRVIGGIVGALAGGAMVTLLHKSKGSFFDD